MASAALLALPKPSSSSPSLQRGKTERDAVYVAAAPLRAVPGPGQTLVSAAYSLGLWDLQHFMVIVKPHPSQPQAVVFDFQPQEPENIYVALAALFRRRVPGVVLKRTLRRMPRSRCWFVGFSNVDALDVADKFNEAWTTNLIVGEHDCRHYTSGLVERLTGERSVLDNLKGVS